MGSYDTSAHPKHVSEVSIRSVPSTKSPDGDLDQGLVGGVCDDVTKFCLEILRCGVHAESDGGHKTPSAEQCGRPLFTFCFAHSLACQLGVVTS